MVTRGQGQRSGSNFKVTIYVKEKAGGLMPESSCFIPKLALLRDMSVLDMSLLYNVFSDL